MSIFYAFWFFTVFRTFKFYSSCWYFTRIWYFARIVLICFEIVLMVCLVNSLIFFLIPYAPIFSRNVNSFHLKPALKAYWFIVFGCVSCLASPVENFGTEASWWAIIQINLAWSSWHHLHFFTAAVHGIGLET